MMLNPLDSTRVHYYDLPERCPSSGLLFRFGHPLVHELFVLASIEPFVDRVLVGADEFVVHAKNGKATAMSFALKLVSAARGPSYWHPSPSSRGGRSVSCDALVRQAQANGVALTFFSRDDIYAHGLGYRSAELAFRYLQAVQGRELDDLEHRVRQELTKHRYVTARRIARDLREGAADVLGVCLLLYRRGELRPSPRPTPMGPCWEMEAVHAAW